MKWERMDIAMAHIGYALEDDEIATVPCSTERRHAELKAAYADLKSQDSDRQAAEIVEPEYNPVPGKVVGHITVGPFVPVEPKTTTQSTEST